MRYYKCSLCDEEHAILEESDMAERIAVCDAHGHEKNCVTAYYGSEDYCWCAFCARKITDEEYQFARNKKDVK